MDSNDDPFVLMHIDVNGFDVENHGFIMTKAEFERLFPKTSDKIKKRQDKDKEELVCGEK